MRTDSIRAEIVKAAKCLKICRPNRSEDTGVICENFDEKILIEENADMAKHTSFKAGGKAAYLITLSSKEELRAVLYALTKLEIPHIFIGNGSNVLFRDEGYDGAVIKMKSEVQPSLEFCKIIDDAEAAAGEDDNAEEDAAKNHTEICYVTCAADMLMSTIAKQVLAMSLSGFEFASGIPGTLGGGLFMNAGAYGGELKDIVESVVAVSADGQEERNFTNAEMQFGYRHSVLQENGYIAVAAVLKLQKDDPKLIEERMRELAQKRNSKQPVQYPSAGSTFKRPEGYFAGKLIEDAGMKGVSVGGAQVSTLHSGFVINKGGATATDILQLISLVQNTVYDRFGVMLEPEVRII